MLDKVKYPNGYQTLTTILDRLDEIILGKRETLELALCCLIARGHLLIEDRPGVGKTTLAHALAKILGFQFKRIQFTSDLLPADIIGFNYFDKNEQCFHLRQGPIFSQIVVADEVNRATPKTQSALLEAMEERQVTIEGERYPLPDPFFVIATQNPSSQLGTFPIPESQLDRFLMKIRLGYPHPKAEKDLLLGEQRRTLIEDLSPQLATTQALTAIQQEADSIHASETLVQYILTLLEHSRQSEHFNDGLSPRAGIALLQSSKAMALIQGRQHVMPEDVQRVLPAVAGHRLRSADQWQAHEERAMIDKLLDLPIPR